MEKAPQSDDREVELNEAKEAFGHTMMMNETFFDLVGRTLHQSPAPRDDLTEVLYEPTYETEDGDEAVVGVRIARRLPHTNRPPSPRAGFAVYDYLPIAIINNKAETVEPHAAVKDEVRTMQDPALSPEEAENQAQQELKALFATWLQGWNDIVHQFGHNITLDRLSKTIVLRHDPPEEQTSG